MKKIFSCLGIMIFTGMLISCRQNGEPVPSPGNNPRVCIGANIRQGVQTRATGLQIPEGTAIRYIIEVWTKEGEDAVYRSEVVPTAEEEISFNFDLEEIGQYTAILWADFIAKDAEQQEVTSPNDYVHYTDRYYRTDSEQGLREIAIIEETYRINDESRDAFYATLTINKEEGIFTSSVTLKRPFGNININEKESALPEEVSEIHCTYQVPAAFHPIDGMPGTGSLSVSTSCKPAQHELANLIYDYIFASPMGDMLAHELTMSFTTTDGAKHFKTYVIPANCLPIAQNKRTIANGTILTTSLPDLPVDTQTSISVTVIPVWDESETEVLPEQSSGDLPHINNQGNPFESIL